MQIGLFGLFGTAASGVLAAFSVSAPQYVCATRAWLVATVLSLRWVDLSGEVLAVLPVGEISNCRTPW